MWQTMPLHNTKELNKEIKKGRVAGQFDEIPLNNFRSSPIGLVPKKVLGDFRLIHHLSWPSGTSVNDLIDPSMCSLKYSCFDDAVTSSTIWPELRTRPDDYSLVGFTFDNKLYYDKAMSMRCSVSCSTWVKFSCFIKWLLKFSSARGKTMHYLDDYLFVGRDGTGDCLSLMDMLHNMCHS
jgi:hypothetical protein